MFDWSAYLGLAEELRTRAGDEAAERSAISRAYYAAFHIARSYLDRTGQAVSRSGGAHGEVAERLGAIDRSIGQDLRRLHGWRKSADYDDPCPFSLSEQAQTAVELARWVVRGIQRLA